MRLRQLLEVGANFDYGSVQVNVDHPVLDAVLRLANLIPDQILAEKGRETEPHITVRYGLIDDPECAVSVLRGFGTITASISGVDIFVSPNHDVLILTVESDDLVRANKLLGERCRFKPSDFDYVPHLTIAYLKSGMGDKVKSAITLRSIQTETMTFSMAMVSARDGSRSTVSLIGTDQ